MESLSSVFAHLRATQPAMQLSLINTRVMLETGVNLKQIRPDQDRNEAVMAKVRAVLGDMGVA